MKLSMGRKQFYKVDFRQDFRHKPNPDYFVSHCSLVDSSTELLLTFCYTLKTH